MKPLYLHYVDHGEAVLYNLTKAQYERIYDSEEDPHQILDKFIVKTDFDAGYAPAVILKLAELLDFEVDSE